MNTAGRSQTQDYDGYYASENLSVPDFINSRLDEIVAGFSGYRVNNRMLEVGIGAGTLLVAAACAGWSVEGVEISKSAIKHCEAQGFTPFLGELSEARFEAGSFDLVVLTELLEHLSGSGSNDSRDCAYSASRRPFLGNHTEFQGTIASNPRIGVERSIPT